MHRHRAPTIAPRRPQDAHFRGNIVQAMVAYAEGELGERAGAARRRVDRIIAIGSDRMMAAVKEARHGVLAPYLKPDHVGIGSINSPMQCMMKEVCAQCLQRHVDPVTGKETFVFSCFNQDQELDRVDFANLARAPAPEHRAGEADEPVARAPAREQVIEPHVDSFSCTVFCRSRAARFGKSTRSIS